MSYSSIPLAILVFGFSWSLKSGAFEFVLGVCLQWYVWAGAEPESTKDVDVDVF